MSLMGLGCVKTLALFWKVEFPFSISELQKPAALVTSVTGLAGSDWPGGDLVRPIGKPLIRQSGGDLPPWAVVGFSCDDARSPSMSAYTPGAELARIARTTRWGRKRTSW